MTRFKALAFLLIIPFLNYGQTDRPISIDELEEDYKVYQESLEEAHPGLYWYRTKEKMDSIFSSSRYQLSQSMTEKEFYTLLASTTAKIGCLHTLMRPSDAFHKTKINEHARPFPFEIKLDQNRMFVYQNLSNDTLMVKGTEILSIADRDVDSLISFFVDKIPNDGYGDNWSRSALERNFRYYYHVFVGEPEYFQLTIRETGGMEKQVSLPGRLEKERYKVLKARYPHAELNEPVISLKYHEETESAILRITRFDNWKSGKKKYKFLRIIKEKMNDILKSDAKNLILDIGDRGGGNEVWGLEILSYLLQEPYTAYKAVEFKTLDYDTSKKYSNTSWLEYNLVKLYLNFNKADSTYNLKNYKGVKSYPPNKKRFSGYVYLIVSGSTASATSDFAAWVDELNLATIIGTETGGSYLGNTSNWEFMVELPNTGLKLQLPLARYLTNVKNGELGRGVIPDYIVPSTINHKLNDVDNQLNFTLQLIKEKQVDKSP